MNLKWEEEGGDWTALHGDIKLEVWHSPSLPEWRFGFLDGDMSVCYVGLVFLTADAAKEMAEKQLRWYLKGKDNA